MGSLGWAQCHDCFGWEFNMYIPDGLGYPLCEMCMESYWWAQCFWCCKNENAMESSNRQTPDTAAGDDRDTQLGYPSDVTEDRGVSVTRGCFASQTPDAGDMAAWA